MDDVNNQAIALHKKLKGKLSVESKVSLTNKDELSLAYTPGVAAVSSAIATNPDLAYEYTIKGHTVAIVTDGSAVLGLGNIGPLAAMPVMEGKAAIFKQFAGINAFPICLDTQDTEEIIATVKRIAPTFGGINLEDISAPRCFEIEERLRAELAIPVMHDDQWGAATVALAALINAGIVKQTDIRQMKVVLAGIGAAGVATARLLLAYGITNIIFCDSKGIIYAGRDDLTKEKKELLQKSTASAQSGTLVDALKGADIFIGLSKPNTVTGDIVRLMNEKPILFTLANPTPEIMPDDARTAGAYIIATGRSDFANQINNSLMFPGAFKAMLEKRIAQFDNGVFIHIAKAIAGCVQNPTPEKIIPSMFDENVSKAVYDAVVAYYE